MSEHKFCESDSDLSSNSSWTILEDKIELQCEEQHHVEETEAEKDMKVIPNTEIEEPHEDNQVSVSQTSIKGESSDVSSDNAFLTFDEYLQERMIEYDSNDDPKEVTVTTKDKESKQRYRKKCKAETIHILSMTCSLLVLTGLSLLCLLFPHNANENIIRSIERNFPSVANIDSCDISQTISALNETADMLSMVSEAKLLDKVKEDLVSSQEINASKTEHDSMAQDGKSHLDCNEEYSLDEEVIEDEDYESDVIYEGSDQTEEDVDTWDATDRRLPSFETPQTSRLSAFKEFLSRTNILTIISCVMHNICVFKLVKHLCRKQEIKQVPKAANDTTGEVEFHDPEGNLQENKTTPKVGMKRKVKLSKINKKVFVKEMPLKHTRTYPMKISEQILRSKAPVNFTPISSPNYFHNNSRSNNMMNSYEKYILNEEICEGMQPKSFELERYKRKTEMFTEQHRKKIKFLKNEFHQKLADAKKKQLESLDRSKRISAIKENFILRLRQHRENYLNELKQLKEERQIFLKELCSKKHTSGVESRDAAVGNYVVPLTGLCDFQEKIKLLKEKESRNKPLAKKSLPLFSNMQASSSNRLYPYQSSPCFKIEKLKMEKYIPFHRNCTREDSRKALTDAAQNEHDRLAEMRQQYLKKQTQILDEYSRLMSDEVTEMEKEGNKLVEPCISLLDEIILEAVDTVHRKNEIEVKQNELIVKEPTSIVKRKPKLKSTQLVGKTDGTCSTGTSREHMQDIVSDSTKTTRNLLKKLDLYTALFEKQARNIRLMESQKLQQEYSEVPPKVKQLSKQDPQKCYIEKIMSKHH